VTSTSSTAQLARRVRLISWLSLAWMSIEGIVGVAAGIATNSIALLGYGLDSTIQGVGSLASSAPRPPPAKEPRTCSARACRWPSSSAWPPTSSSV
jgi:hypothetical protein